MLLLWLAWNEIRKQNIFSMFYSGIPAGQQFGRYFTASPAVDTTVQKKPRCNKKWRS